mgnify:CR=1 FL=1
MAIGNVGGFSEGFTRGFGLVNQVQQQRANDQFRQDQLAAQSQRDADTAAFRQQQLADTAEQNRLTADFRKTSLEFQEERKLAQLGYNSAMLAAETDPSSPKYQKLIAEANKINAEAGDVRADAVLKDRYAGRVTAAENLNLGTMLALKPELTDTQKADFAKLVEANEGTAFDFGEISDYVADEVATDVTRSLQNISQGGDPTMSPAVARSFSRALKLKDTAAMGRVIDDQFENAPEHLKDGNYKVVDQGLYRPKLNQDGTISGEMYVIARNTVTGDDEPYFAPITDNRVSIGGQESSFDVNEITQVAASQIQMREQLAPIVRQRTREAKILTKFGDISKMDSGVEAFSGTVNQELDRYLRGLQGGGTPSGIMALLNKAELQSLKGEQLTPSQTNMLRQRIEDNLLFGTTATAPQFGVGQWVEEARSGLKDVPLPLINERVYEYTRDQTLDGVPERKLGKDEVKTLGDLINIDGMTDRNIAELNGLFDSEGNISNPALYFKKMIELGFMFKRKTD